MVDIFDVNNQWFRGAGGGLQASINVLRQKMTAIEVIYTFEMVRIGFKIFSIGFFDKVLAISLERFT